MAFRTLADRLVERAFCSRRSPLAGGFGVSRRGFLAGMGTLGGTVALPSPAEAQPYLERTGRTLSLYQGNSAWEIDAARFGTFAEASGETRADGLVLRLRRATLPGTTLRIDLWARVHRGGRRWLITLFVPKLRLRATVPLQQWLARSTPLASRGRLPAFRLGDHRVSGRPNISASLTADFELAVDGGAERIALSGVEGLNGAKLHLAPSPLASDLATGLLPSNAPGGVTRFALIDTKVAPAIPLGDGSPGDHAFCPEGVDSCSGEVTGEGADLTSVTLVDGHGSVQLADGDQGTRLRLERASLARTSDGVVALAGRVQRAVQTIEAGACAVQVAGDDDAPFYCEFRDGRAVSLEAQVRLYEAWLPIPDADQGRLVAVSPLAMSLRMGENDHDAPTPAIMLGASGGIRIPGEAVRLNIRRGLDLFNLDFEFTGFDLDLRRRQARMLRRAAPDGSWQKAALGVVFPPQHLSETIANTQDPTYCKPPADMPRVSSAKLSGPSRVAFKIGEAPGEAPRWTERPLSLAALTEWRDLALEVCARALPVEATLDEQLEIEQVGAASSMDEVARRISAQFRAPEAYQTSLELSTRLILSPDRLSKFITPPPLGDPNLAPLWTARLDARGRASTRVVWSRFLQGGGTGCQAQALAKGAAEPPIDAADQRELVLLMSIYGMPALRAIRDDDGNGNDPLAKIARSTVVRPADPPAYIRNDEDLGIFVPVAFRDADVILSSIGASVRAEWIGEPPVLRGPDPWRGGLNIERLGYYSHLGRDITVEVQKKGYLMPLGVRASYLVLVERRFFRNAKLDDRPVAFPVRRRYIFIQRPERDYPGVNHPYEGRECPMRAVAMITRKTPDLVDPANPGGGAIAIGAQKAEHAFWPRTVAGVDDEPGVFSFKWAVDGDPAPVTSPLLFVASAITTDPELVRGAVDHYRKLSPQSNRRIARHGGARRRYADPLNDGETAFGTDHWVMSARGRLLPGTGGTTESFLMDGRMEGNDQPPFYPVLQQAAISIQSLDRLLGTPQGLIQVGYDPTYILAGFDPSQNASQIFLDVLGPDIRLDVNAGGQSSGGLAKPNSLVAALSRSNGIIGGTRADNVLPPPRRALAITSAPSTPYDFSSALDGRFDPTQFFSADAKLLGLVDFRDVVAQADFAKDIGPRLLEKVGYGPLEGNALDGLKAVAKRAQNVPAAIRAILVTEVVKGLPIQDVYPRFYAVARDTATQLETSLALIDQATSLAAIVEPAANVVAVGKAMLAAVAELVRDPVPDVVEGNIDKILGLWTQFKDGVASAYRDLPQLFFTQILAPRIDAFCHEIDQAGLAKTIWGKADVDCTTIVTHPSDALAAIGDALFKEAFAEPLLGMLRDIQQFQAEIDANLRIAAVRLDREIERIVEDLVVAWPEIAPGSPIRLRARRAELAAAAATTMQRRLDLVTGGTAAKPTQAVLTILDAVIADPNWAVGFAIDLVNAINVNAWMVVTTPPTPATEVLDDLKSRASQLGGQFADALQADANRLRAIVEASLNAAEQQTLARIFAAIDTIIHGIERSAAFAQVSEYGRAVSGWCAAVAGPTSARVVILADDLCSGVLGDAAAIAASLTKLRDAVANLAIPAQPDEVRQRLEATQRVLLVEIDRLVTIVAEIVAARETLRDIRNELAAGNATGICEEVGRFLDPCTRLLQLRCDAVERLGIVLREAGGLVGIAPPLTLAPGTVPPSQVIVELVAQTKFLLGSLTSLSASGTAKWARIAATITDFAKAVSARVPDYAAELKRTLDEVSTAARTLAGRLTKATDLAALRLVAYDLEAFAAAGDRRLAAVALQSSALSKGLADRLGNHCATILRRVSGELLPIHSKISNLVQEIHDSLVSNPVLKLIVNPDLLANIEAVKKLLFDDTRDLNFIAKPGAPIEQILPRARTLALRWRAPDKSGLVATIGLVGDLVRNIMRGKLDQIVTTGPLLKQIQDEIENKLEELISSLVPTRVDLSYDLKTKLNPIRLPGGKKPLFAMKASAGDDLTIETRVSIDLVSQQRSARSTGKLKAFDIGLIGSFDIATLRFSGASFESIDGGAPRFDVDLASVELGETLRMLDVLRPWFSPNGNGFYITPCDDPGPGVEAGYVYGADLIQVGTLQFINVTLGAAVRLPFGPHSAELLFWCSSELSMFLIASPPYGGSGYLNVRTRRGGKTDVSLALACGAVAAIKFGPLRGHGHILAGIGYKSATNELTGFVEAIGEGSIGCFGICISIRVTLTHRTDTGRVDGRSKYQVEFRVGFAKIKYGFTASYTVSEGSRSSQARALMGFVGGAESRRVASSRSARFAITTPRKADQWREYKAGVALDLLGAEP